MEGSRKKKPLCSVFLEPDDKKGFFISGHFEFCLFVIIK